MPEATPKSTWVDPDDAPEITGEWVATAELRDGDKVIPRGCPTDSGKGAATIRFDDDVLAAFKATGPGWQSRINGALRDWLKTHSPDEVSL